MKKTVFLIIAFLILPSLFVIGSRQIQSENISNVPPRPSKTSYPMPDFEIECSLMSIKPGDEVVFFLKSKTNEKDIEKSEPKYDWFVSDGEIISGQGTRSIKVKTFPNSQGNLNVQVRITAQAGGYLESPISRNCIIPFEELPVAVRNDEFTFSTQGELKARLDSFFVALANNPSAQGYIIIYPPSARERIRVEKIITDFIKWRNYDRSRITIIVIGEKKDIRAVLQFWIVPAGADSPTSDTQNAETRNPRLTVKANASACELNSLYLDLLRTELGNNPNLSVKIVFSPGKTETSAVNLKRQKIFMDNIKNRFPNVETQIGAKTEGEGEVTIFIQEPGREEQLYLLIYAIKNKSVCLNCCDPSDAPKSLVTTKKKRK